MYARTNVTSLTLACLNSSPTIAWENAPTNKELPAREISHASLAAFGVRQNMRVLAQNLRGIDGRHNQVVALVPDVVADAGEYLVITSLLLHISLLAIPAGVMYDHLQVVQDLDCRVSR